MRWPWQKNTHPMISNVAQLADLPTIRTSPDPVLVGEEDEWEIDLPFYPGDCSRSQECSCSWSITTSFEGDYEVTKVSWIKLPQMKCPDAIERAATWNNREIRRSPKTFESWVNTNPQKNKAEYPFHQP